MELSLIWVCEVAFSLCAIAFVSALAAHFRGKWGKAAGTGLVLLASVGLFAVCTLLVVFSLLAKQKETFAAFTVVALIGGAAIALLGRKSPAPGLPTRAASWPRARLGLLLLALFAVLTTTTRNARIEARQAFDARRTELVNLEQIWWPGIPASLNAAPFYARAYQQLVSLDAVPGSHPAFEALWSDAPTTTTLVESPVLLEWTKRNQRALALAVEGTEQPGYASVEDALWRSNPFDSGRRGKIFRLESSRIGHDSNTIDNQVSRRRLGDLLKTRSLQRAFAGQFAPAIQDANAVLSLAEQTGSAWLNPTLVVEKLLSAPGMTADALGALHFPAGDGLDVHMQRYLIRSEHADVELSGIFDLRALAGWSMAKDNKHRDGVDNIFIPINEIFWSQSYNEESTEYYDRLWKAAYAAVPQRVAKLREFGEAPPPSLGSGMMPMRFVADGLIGQIANEAKRDCAEVGVAVARYRIQQGKFPERLDQLVPNLIAELPADPFTGAPLRYLASANEARVYSIGPDMKDDGGAALKGDGATAERTGDVVFTVPAPVAK